MFYEEDYTKDLEKYLPQDEKIEYTAKLRPSKDPSTYEIFALTSSSIIKFKKVKNEELLDQTYLRHITSLKLSLNPFNLKLLIIGIILAVFGSMFLIISTIPPTLYSLIFFLMFIIIGACLLIPGIKMIVNAFKSGGGNIQIFSYDTENPIIDAHYSSSQIDNILTLVRLLHIQQKLAKLE